MSLYIKVGNKWYNKEQYHTFHSNNKIVNKFVRTVSSNWNPVYSYSFVTTSDWSTCTKLCNTGTQDLIKKCKRNDGTYVTNNYCVSAGVAVPTISGASKISYSATASQVRYRRNCNTQVCRYYYRAASDDRQNMWIKYKPYASWIDLGGGGSSCDRDSGCSTASISSYPNYLSFTATGDFDGTNIYMKYSHWDTNGTSWHAHLRLSNNGVNWTPHVVHFPYNGAGRRDAGSRSWYWFIWNVKTNAVTYVAAATNSTNTSCGSQGGYQYTSYMGQWWVNGSVRGCGSGEPF